MSEELKCPQCGAALEPGATECKYCGEKIAAAIAPKATGTDEYLGGKDKVTMAILCFFLGGLGVHNFMMGETKKGIFKIAATCCFGIGCIFALIDFIKILTDKYEVAPDKLI